MAEQATEGLAEPQAVEEKQPPYKSLTTVHHGLYYATLLIYAAIAIPTLVYCVVAPLITTIVPWFPLPSGTWRFEIVAFLVVYTFVAWKINEITTAMGVTVLGIPVLEKDGPGPLVVLPGIMSAHAIPRPPRQRQFPAEPERIQYTDEKVPLEKGKVHQVFITSGPPLAKEVYDDILNFRMTTAVTGTVRYKANHFFDFWSQTAGVTPEEKFAYLERELLDTWAETLKGQWRTRPIGKVIDESDQIVVAVKNALDKKTEGRGWGVTILEINIYTPNLTHDLNTAMAKIGIANATAEATIKNAMAKAKQIELEGFATASVKRKTIEEEGAGTKKAADDMGVDSTVALASRTVSDALSDKTTFVLGAEGVAQAAGGLMATAFAAANSKTAPKQPAPAAASSTTS